MIEAYDDSPTDSRATPRHRTPLWVKGFLIAAAAPVVVFSVIHLSGDRAMNHTP
ncbi:hypothetical protein PV768_16095 [Pseudarthrobacter sp. CC4]|uniref:hypothetical protein n=1 Tax=Pseudarthrobacter sp. CC4 TaxID=3029190 RepID=UPI003B8BCB0B